MVRWIAVSEGLPRFLIYDLESGTFEMLDNDQNLHAAQGCRNTVGGNSSQVRGGMPDNRPLRAKGLPGPDCGQYQDL